MMNLDIPALVSTYGLIVLAPLAVFEGPVVTLIGAWLASQGLLSLPGVFIVVVLADLIGDGLYFGLGRLMLDRLSERWRKRLGLSPERVATLVAAFEQRGSAMLLAGKWTHAAGFAVLVAAGAARMPFWQFIWVNLLATLPKSLIFVALGYAFGSAHDQIAAYISTGGAALVALLALAVFIWIMWRRRGSS